MNYKRLADMVRRFYSIDLLASEIETLEDEPLGVETVDELADFLRDELDYSGY